MTERRIDRNALFADETPGFRYPEDVEAGDEVIFRFRTGKEEGLEVYLVGNVLQRRMERCEEDEYFCYYETRATVGAERFFYSFEVKCGDEIVIYNRLGPSVNQRFNPKYAFSVLPGFHVPDWTKGAVIYQIFVDRFMNGDPGNDVLTNEYRYLSSMSERVEDRNAPVEEKDVHRFYGGDLVGVRQKLDYLKHLGVECIYFNPLFVSPSNHKYDTEDYDHIDPHFTGFVHDFGALLDPEDETTNVSERYVTRVTDPENLQYSDRYFADLVSEIHKRGMKVILDGVFNHCGSFHKWMDREGIYKKAGHYPPGAYESEDSPYRDFFYFEENDWPSNDSYLGWWEHKTLPKLAYEKSPDLTEKILDVGRKWVSEPYNADGWRLDVAADLGNRKSVNHAFWKAFRKAVRTENPEALLVAEHYGDPSSWFHGDEWDTVMNYDAFMEPVSYFLTGMEKHSDEYDAYLHGNGTAFFRTLTEKMAYMPAKSLYAAMNELSNHDHSRFLTRTNCTVGRLSGSGAEAAGENVSYATFREGVVMQFTLPGAPTVYYGDEAGLAGWTDPDDRRPYPWGHEITDLITFHRDVIAIHKKVSCLKTGSFLPLKADYGYVSYGRFDQNSAALILINHSDHARTVTEDVWRLGMTSAQAAKRILQTGEGSYNVGVVSVPVKDGKLEITVPAWSATILIQ
ncbi:MAG: glycoside hydrolase family 13 protein [Lachnospiraceae bacterium]|nr:glycoside hydrolase family 13 protein [Lachnospiraceae bacterium]